VLGPSTCGGAGPARASARGFVLQGCAAGLGPLIGHAFGRTPPVYGSFWAAAEVAAPRAGTCWVMTEIVVHYHVGITHYSATGPYQLAVCAHGQSGQVNAAINAAEGLG
jgi:hypothetical protein